MFTAAYTLTEVFEQNLVIFCEVLYHTVKVCKPYQGSFVMFNGKIVDISDIKDGMKVTVKVIAG